MKLPHALVTALRLGLAAGALAPLGCQPGDAHASIPNTPAPAPDTTPPPPPAASPTPAPSGATPARVVRLKPIKVARPAPGPIKRAVLDSPERKRRDPCPACGMG